MHSLSRAAMFQLGRASLSLALLLASGIASAQINRFWVGSVNSDWFNPTNWSPAGVPATNDIVNVTNGTVNLSAPVVINNQFNWLGGTLSGDAMTIASNAVMNIAGSTTLTLENALTNAGTVTWSNNCDLNVPNGSGIYFGLIENLAGSLFDVQNNQSLYNSAGTAAYFRNAGTLRKSAGAGSTTILIPAINLGSVTSLQGTLIFNAGAPITGAFAAASGAAIDFAGGNFTNSVPVAVNGPGEVQLTGGTLTLLTDIINNLALTGGTVYLGPAFQGGAITNLTIDGATLAGTNTVTGTFNWNNGAIAGGSLTVASNGVMTMNGTTTLMLQSPLTNAGTVTWTNNCELDVPNGSGLYFGLIENLAGALFDIQNDQSLVDNAAATTYFYNAGTLRKSAGTGVTTFTIPVVNSGTVTALQGTLNFNGGGPLTGTFAAASGAAIDFSGGNFTNSGPVSLNGPGPIQFTGGNLTLLANVIPSLPLTGGTVFLGPAFQGGTITNLTLDGATLAGTNVVTGTFNWDNGTIAGGPLTVASNGVLYLNGTTTLMLQNALTNAGTVIWTNNGNLDVPNGAGIYFGLIENLPGALFDIENDQSLFNNAGTAAYFHNAGTLLKSANTGTTTISIPIINSGSVTGLVGTLSFNGGGPLSGTFTAEAGAAIVFSGGNFTNSAPVAMNGPGTVQFTGGNLLLLTDAIANFPLLGGTVNVGPAFQGGAITNLTIGGATLAGTNTVTGTFNWGNGTIAGGSLTIASNGVMNISGSTTLFLECPLTNSGTVNWTNVGSLGVLNGAGLYFGLIQNLAGGLFDIQNDQSLFNNAAGGAYFYNAGTLLKSSHPGTSGISIPVTNSGTITALEGNIAFEDGILLGGGTLLFGMSGPTSFGSMSISGNALLSGSAGALWLNGFVPSYGNSFTVLAYGSFTGAFTNLILPPAAIWKVTYGPTAFVLAIGGINKLAFTNQPLSGKLINQALLPVVVQVEDTGGNPLATNAVPITLSLNSGSGSLSGTLTQNTDPTGKATFSDLSINIVGTKTLRAASPGLTAAVSAPFQIVPLIGEQLTSTGLLLQLNGTNSFGATTISASTDLVTWLPLYTNAATNGPILFLDSSATNYRARFYQIIEQ